MNTAHRIWRIAAMLLVLAACAGPVTARTSDTARPQVAQVVPDDAIRVCETCEARSLAGAIDGAPEGATIAVEGGTHDGPIVVDKTLTLIGIGNPVIDGRHEGTVVRISAPGVVFQGFIVRNSGNNFDKEDSAIYLDGAEGAQILDNQLLDALFGVNVAQSHRIVIARNLVVGKDVDMGVRGDGIKVWYSHESQIVGNHVQRSRDLLVWYSNFVVVRDNVVEDGRYGFHFMNSDDGVAEHNQLIDNSVGIYLMYGKRFVIKDNLLQGSRGPSGHGLGLKEIDGVDVIGNVIYDNRIGVYIDNSPLSPDVYDRFEHNLIAYNDSGLGLLPSSRNNVFTANSLVDNLEQVTVLGGGPIGDNQWSVDGVGNFWSDYAGYDANGDGIGDVPFRNEELSEQLMSNWPILQLFRFSAAEAAVDFGAKAVPMFRQDPVFEDPAPLVDPVLPTNAAMPEQHDPRTAATAWSIGMLVLAAAAVWWGLRGRRAARRLLPAVAYGTSSAPSAAS
jgi:nitrous oxidase accessory protein